MRKERLYRLMDILDEIKQIDEILSFHRSNDEGSSIMIDQYKFRKEELLGYFIKELSVSENHLSSRLHIINSIMNRFYQDPSGSTTDKDLMELTKALSA